MTLNVSVESTYTRKLSQLEQLCELARRQNLTDDATVTFASSSTVVITEVQPEPTS